MIRTAGEILVATSPIDLRLSFDRPAAIAHDALGGDPTGDAIFVFHNRHRTHANILARDATGSRIPTGASTAEPFRFPTAIPP